MRSSAPLTSQTWKREVENGAAQAAVKIPPQMIVTLPRPRNFNSFRVNSVGELNSILNFVNIAPNVQKV